MPPASSSAPAANDAGVTPIKRSTAGQQVADSIRRLVWDGVLRPETRLNQEDLAAQLGVSRIPVRDALMALEREGLVRMQPHKGAYLNRLDEEATRDHYDLFGLIYAFALERAALRSDDVQLDDLVTLADTAAKATRADGLQNATTRFWGLTLRLGGSPRLHAVSKSLTGMVPGNFFDEIPGTEALTRDSMRRLAAALRERDAELAAGTCRTMLSGHGELVVEVMRERGLYSGRPEDEAEQT